MEYQTVVFWRGCTLRNIASDTISKIGYIFRKAGINVAMLSDEWCCGYPLLLAGYEEKFRKYASRVVESLMNMEYDLVVTHCPGCLRAFKQLYPRYGFKQLKVLHTTQLLHQLLDRGALKLERGLSLRVVYHDPCDLGRHLGIYSEPREVVKSIPGVSLIELPEMAMGKYSRCCGGGGLLRLVIPPLASQIAVDRLVEDLAGLDIQAVVTACPTCVKTLHNAASVAETIYGISIEVRDVVDLVYSALG
ncbi:MAG: (Fe-S)-binding protein [Ignisphaera sp.]